MSNEFQIIRQFFQHDISKYPDLLLGVGDDAAVWMPPADRRQVVAMDTLVSQVHFLESWSAHDIGYRALAVNLSDLAAMGATPRWALLSIAAPQMDERWFEDFARGFFKLARQYEVALIGGDMTRGPFTITVTIGGDIALPQQPLTRSNAQVGDCICVTGSLGLAALALADHQGQVTLTSPDRHTAYQQWLCPQPHILAGQLLLPMANAAIDISDGLAQDLSHILQASQVGARLQMAQLPIAATLATYATPAQQLQWALTGGDDYQLCVTMAPTQYLAAKQCLVDHGIALTRIGEITATGGLQCVQEDQSLLELATLGYQHWNQT